jgi:restriction system protein
VNGVIDDIDSATGQPIRPCLITLRATRKLKSSGDGGVDVMAFDRDPIRGAKYVIQAKKYTHKVQPAAVRELFGTLQHEGANNGILVTTHGFTSGCHEFANGKPIQLYDGTHLLALCREYGIEARIVLPTKTS